MAAIILSCEMNILLPNCYSVAIFNFACLWREEFEMYFGFVNNLGVVIISFLSLRKERKSLYQKYQILSMTVVNNILSNMSLGQLKIRRPAYILLVWHKKRYGCWLANVWTACYGRKIRLYIASYSWITWSLGLHST